MQLTIFDGDQKFHNTKPIRLITLFSGYDSQALSLKYLGVPFEHYRTCEWAIPSIQALKDLHFGEDSTNYSENLTKEELVRELAKLGISADYNVPLSEKQIARYPEQKVRTIYNNIKASHNLVSITNIHGADLGIVDTERYCYIMTYSFPCQDLSNAGLGKGMEKGSGTRSGLLWEVERLLTETKELPQILLMENVKQVIGQNNIKDFAKWIEFLDGLGYNSKWQVLNAKDFGVPQNRERCFMVSVLGGGWFSLPEPMRGQKKLKDVLALDEQNKTIRQDTIGTLTTDGSSPKHNNRVIECYGIQRNETKAFMKKPLKECSRTILANKSFGGGGVLMTKTAIPNEEIERLGEEYALNGTEIDTANYRIRKLTERECGRLMGVKDDDIDKIGQHLSTSAQYHCYGDSIVTTCLMAIFGELLDVEWKDKVEHIYNK